VNKVIGVAAVSNVQCSFDGPCLDDFTSITRDRKVAKQDHWLKKAKVKATEKGDFPKIDGQERIRILRTRIERKLI
jgi:hypothetical protein